jgi:hypothetical protein
MLVAFRSKLTAAAGDDYTRMAQAMKRWRHHRRALSQRRISSADPRHRVAQANGRESWNEYYNMDVAGITRVSHFTRPSLSD